MGIHTRIAPGTAHPPAISDWCGGVPEPVADPQFLQYLHSRFAVATEERLHVVYCDMQSRYLHDETLTIGSESQLVLKARALVYRALTIGAGGLILAHNHLSGKCRPSQQDIDATRRLSELGAALELQLIDHLIFTRERFFSMAAAGLLH